MRVRPGRASALSSPARRPRSAHSLRGCRTSEPGNLQLSVSVRGGACYCVLHVPRRGDGGPGARTKEGASPGWPRGGPRLSKSVAAKARPPLASPRASATPYRRRVRIPRSTGGSLAGRNRSVMPARPPVAFHPGGTPGGATRGEGSHGRGSLGPSEDGRRCPTVHAGRRWGGTGASVGRRSVPAPDEGGSSSRGGGAEAYSIAWRGGGSNRATRIMNFRWSSAASSLVVWYLSRKK
jgi:hypothetical protein